MAKFAYSAYDNKGMPHKGSVNAESSKQARRALKDRGLLVTDMSEGKNRKARNWSFNLNQGLSNADLALILEQLGVLLQSGMTLEESLKLLANQAESSKQKAVVSAWHSLLLEGHSLSQSMRRSEFDVPERVAASVAVGEETGHLESIVLRTAEEMELSAKNKEILRRGLSYPITLLVVATIVVTILMTSVVPKIALAFQNSKMELPEVTQAVIAVSDFFVSYGLVCLIFLCMSVGIVYWWLGNLDNRRQCHKHVMSLPMIGDWQRKANLSDWARSLGVLLASGVPALVALRISSAVVSNLHLRACMEKVSNEVSDGNSLHSALIKHEVGEGFLQHMVGSGEASSQLDVMLLRVSDYYTSRLRNSVDRALSLMSPILIMLLGGLVLTIVAAVMQPILAMSTEI